MQLRARRALSLFNNVLLRTKRVLSQAWDRKYLKKEEDNLARERIDRAGGGCGRGAAPPPPSDSRDFGISGIKNNCFNALILESNFLFKKKKNK